MTKLILKLIRIGIRWLGTFLLILSLAVVIFLTKSQYTKYKANIAATESVQNIDLAPVIREAYSQAKQSLDAAQKSLESTAKARIEGLQRNGETAVKERIAATTKEIARLDATLKVLKKTPPKLDLSAKDMFDPENAIRRAVTASADYALKKAKLSTQLDLLEQERSYLTVLRNKLAAENALSGKKTNCRQRDKSLLAKKADVLTLRAEVLADRAELLKGVAVSQDKIRAVKVRSETLRRRTADYKDATEIARSCHIEANQLDKAVRNAAKAATFAADRTHIAVVLDQLSSEERELKSAVDNKAKEWKEALVSERNSMFIAKAIVEPVRAVFWGSIVIFVGSLVVPLLAKAITYWCLAPLAIARAPVSLRSECLGAERVVSPSAVSVRLSVEEGAELVVQSKYLRSVPSECYEAPKAVLNDRRWRASLWAEMYGLTVIRSKAPASVTLSGGENDLNELAVIEVPAGSALSVNLHHLVGVIQASGSPPEVEVLRRFGHLQSWMRRQWRYLVLHGPIQIVVKGWRGIRVADVHGARNEDDSRTVAFSANLLCSTERVGDWLAYFRGDVQLMRAKFRGENGIVVHEEAADPAKRKPVLESMFGLSDRLVDVLSRFTGS